MGVGTAVAGAAGSPGLHDGGTPHPSAASSASSLRCCCVVCACCCCCCCCSPACSPVCSAVASARWGVSAGIVAAADEILLNSMSSSSLIYLSTYLFPTMYTKMDLFSSLFILYTGLRTFNEICHWLTRPLFSTKRILSSLSVSICGGSHLCISRGHRRQRCRQIHLMP